MRTGSSDHESLLRQPAIHQAVNYDRQPALRGCGNVVVFVIVDGQLQPLVMASVLCAATASNSSSKVSNKENLARRWLSGVKLFGDLADFDRVCCWSWPLVPVPGNQNRHG